MGADICCKPCKASRALYKLAFVSMKIRLCVFCRVRCRERVPKVLKDKVSVKIRAGILVLSAGKKVEAGPMDTR